MERMRADKKYLYETDTVCCSSLCVNDKGGDGSAVTLQRDDWRIMASRNRIVKERNTPND